MFSYDMHLFYRKPGYHTAVTFSGPRSKISCSTQWYHTCSAPRTQITRNLGAWGITFFAMRVSSGESDNKIITCCPNIIDRRSLSTIWACSTDRLKSAAACGAAQILSLAHILKSVCAHFRRCCAAASAAIPLSVVYIGRARSEAHDFIITIISGGAPGRTFSFISTRYLYCCKWSC